MRRAVFILALALAAIAAPALAQQKAASTDRAMAQGIAWQKRVVEIFNTHNAAAVSALYAADAVFVDPTGNAARGRAAIETAEAALFKIWGDFKFASTVKEARAIGSGLWLTYETTIEAKGANGPFTVRLHGLNVLVGQGKARRIAVTSLGANPSPR